MENSATFYSEKGFEAYRNKDFSAAKEAFQQSLDLYKQNNDMLAAAEMQNNLCVVLLELKETDEAFSAVQGTDAIFAAANDKKRQAIALGNIATVLQTQGKLEEALTMFENSAALFKDTNEKDMRAITLKKISDLQLKTGKQFQAMASLDASYNQKEKLTLKEKILQSFLGTLFKKLFH